MEEKREDKNGVKYVLVIATKAHVILPCGKVYEGSIEEGKQNPGHLCLKCNKSFRWADKLKIKKREDYLSQGNECECDGILNERPFMYAEGERFSNGSMCRIEFCCEEGKHLDGIIKYIQELYKSQNGKKSMVYYKIDKLEKFILNHDISRILKRFPG